MRPLRGGISSMYGELNIPLLQFFFSLLLDEARLIGVSFFVSLHLSLCVYLKMIQD